MDYSIFDIGTVHLMMYDSCEMMRLIRWICLMCLINDTDATKKNISTAGSKLSTMKTKWNTKWKVSYLWVDWDFVMSRLVLLLLVLLLSLDYCWSVIAVAISHPWVACSANHYRSHWAIGVLRMSDTNLLGLLVKSAARMTNRFLRLEWAAESLIGRVTYSRSLLGAKTDRLAYDYLRLWPNGCSCCCYCRCWGCCCCFVVVSCSLATCC